MGGGAPAPRAGLRAVAFALALSALSGCPEGPPPPSDDAGAPSIANLVIASGTVTVERAGPPAPLPAGAKLFSGDVVATGPSSSAVVRTPDGQALEASERTRFRLTATASKLVVQLLEGRLVSSAGAGDGGVRALEVKAPGTETELKMGDVIDITARGAGSTLKVTEGEIVLVTPDGGTQTVGAGQTAQLEMGEIRLVQQPPAAAEPISITLASEHGKTLLRPRGQRKFNPAGDGEVPVPDGTAFQVAKGGRAVLSSKSGMKARLVAAGGLLESAVLEGASERYTYGLDSGEVQLQFPGGAERRVTVRGGGKSLQVTASEPTTATVVASKKGPKLLVMAGTVKVGEGDGALTVAPGQVVDLAAGEPKVTALPRPPLVVPARRVRVYSDGIPSVGLAVPEGAKTVQVAADKDFGQVLAEGRAPGDYLPYAPPTQGEVHWRALGQDGAVMAKGSARFDRDPDASVDAIEHPRAEVTETGLKAVVYFQSVLPEITFVYPARDGAVQYRLRVYKADDLKNPLWQREEKDLRSTVPAGKIGEGSYLWYAAGLSAQGAELAGGRMNKLDMIYDNSRRSLAIARPRQGERVGKVVESTGVAPIGSKLTLNGKAATLDGKGRFRVSVPSSPFLVFRLLTDDGGESYWIRQVRSR